MQKVKNPDPKPEIIPCLICGKPSVDSESLCSKHNSEYWVDPAGGVHPETNSDDPDDFYDAASAYE